MTTPLRVLLVEDNQADARLVVRELEVADYRVSWERVDKEAEFRDRLSPELDVIISDFSLPQFDAPRALEALKETSLDIPFLVVTGTITEEVAVECMKQGAADYLLKDRLSRLGQAVARALDARRVREEQRRTHESLRDSERLFRTLADTAPALIRLVDGDKRCYYLNKQWLEFTGCGLEAGPQDRWIERIHAADREKCLRAYTAAFDDRQPFSMEYRICRADDELRWLLDRGVPCTGTDGEFSGFIFSAVDVTEQIQAAETLRGEREFLEIVLDSIDVAVVAASPDAHVTLLNGAARALHETDAADSTFEKLAANFQFFEPDGHTVIPMERLPLQRALDGETVASQEVVFVPQSGAARTLVVSSRPITASGARVKGAVLVAEDVTRRKQLEEQLRQSQKMEAVGRLAGGVAHDFNNLLTVIGGYAEMTLKRLRPDDPLSAGITEIHAASKRASALTRQLLAFSRKQVLQPKVVDLNALIGQLVKMLGRLIGEDVKLELHLDDDLGRIRVDPGQMEQVIVNLVVNARDALPSGGSLSIATRNAVIPISEGDLDAGSWVVLEVGDTGCGMDAETLSHIFEPFFTTKGPEEGTGLGLATVYGIVEQSGGKIRVETERGRGTVFRLHFPRVERALDLEPLATKAERGRGAGEVVMLVEDDAAVRQFMRLTLEARGYRVVEASNGEEALGIMRERTIRADLVISDLVMPGITGLEFSRRVRDLLPSVAILLISGYSDREVDLDALPGVRASFLHKPFSPDALTRRVRRILDRRG